MDSVNDLTELTETIVAMDVYCNEFKDGLDVQSARFIAFFVG